MNLKYFLCVFLFLPVLSCKNSPQLITKEVSESIPFYYSYTGHILVDIVVNNKTYPFLVDSAAGTVVFDNFLQSNPLELIGSMNILDGNGKLIPSKVYHLKQLQLGSSQFKNMYVNHIPKFPLTCSGGIFGILGRDIMKLLIWQFDFKNQNINLFLTKNQLPIAKNSFIIPIKKSTTTAQLYLQAKVDSMLIDDITIDTGSNGFLSLNSEDFENTYHKRTKIKGIGSIGLGGASTKETFYSKVNKFCLQDVCVNNLDLDISKNSSKLIGLGFFKNFLTTINWKDQELTLSPYDKQNFQFKSFGLKMRYEEEGEVLIVKSLTEDSPPDSLGIELGDTIQSINGIAINSETVFCNLNLRRLDTINMDIKKGDLTKQYRLYKYFY